MKLREQLENYIPYNEQEINDKDIMLECLERYDDVLTRDNRICHFTASNWIVNKQRTKILMAYHNIYKSWAWTGGHADGNEDLCQVALKEAKEETGVQNLKLLSDGIYAIQILTVDSHIKKGKFVSDHLHLDCCFLFEADEEELLQEKEDENSAIGWIEIERVTEVKKKKKMRPVYKKLNEKLRNIPIIEM